MIETLITICALTFASPYYDCNEKWDIEIYDGKIPNAEGVLGRAIYKNSILEDTNIIQLSHDYKERIGKWDRLMKSGGGVLWHEILHMKCKCDWHSHWDVLREIKGDNHSRVRIPIIPQSVLPFLKI